MDAETEEKIQSIIEDAGNVKDFLEEFFHSYIDVKIGKIDVDTKSLDNAMNSIDTVIDQLDELEYEDSVLDSDEIREIKHYASFHGYQPGTCLSSWILEQLKKGEK